MVGFLIPGVRSAVIHQFTAARPDLAESFSYGVRVPFEAEGGRRHTAVVAYTHADAFAAWLDKAGIPYQIVPAALLLPEEVR